jgi:hypothetical protein
MLDIEMAIEIRSPLLNDQDFFKIIIIIFNYQDYIQVNESNNLDFCFFAAIIFGHHWGNFLSLHEKLLL